MIDRYTRPQMAEIWSLASKYRLWFEVEAHACEALEAAGTIPAGTGRAVRKAAEKPFDQARIAEIERETRHDLLAFLAHLGERTDPAYSRYIHFGMTSSDVVDTTFSVQLCRATDLLTEGLEKLCAVLRRRAHEHKYLLRVGRSHGIHAEPLTLGLAFARFYAEMRRNLKRMATARQEIAVGAISGAVGTFAHLGPAVEAHVCRQMGLRPEPVSSQIIPRDRHAAFFSALAVTASSVENIATEIRHMQRSELREAEESFARGQKGSSAMPHKRNPVLSENLVGLARVVRMAVVPALENVALWHERDISHSSVERIIAPDATATLDFALHRLAGVLENLVVNEACMAANLDLLGGLIHSQRVLLALAEAGVERGLAYQIVQKRAHDTWESGGSFLDALLSDPEIAQVLDATTLKGLFDPTHHIRYVDHIFERVFAD